MDAVIDRMAGMSVMRSMGYAYGQETVTPNHGMNKSAIKAMDSTYQCKKAFLLNIAVNCSETLLKSSWMAVELPMNVADIFKPRGGMSQTAV